MSVFSDFGEPVTVTYLMVRYSVNFLATIHLEVPILVVLRSCFILLVSGFVFAACISADTCFAYLHFVFVQLTNVLSCMVFHRYRHVVTPLIAWSFIFVWIFLRWIC